MRPIRGSQREVEPLLDWADQDTFRDGIIFDAANPPSPESPPAPPGAFGPPADAFGPPADAFGPPAGVPPLQFDDDEVTINEQAVVVPFPVPGTPAPQAAAGHRAAPGEVLLRARDDLTVERLGDKLVIEDQKKSSFTQLGLAEYLVFRLFDGRSSLTDIIARLKQERGLDVSMAHMIRLRDRLHAKQLIIAQDEAVVGEDVQVRANASLIERITMIEMPIRFDPDLFLTRVYHRVKYLVFRPAFFVCLGILVVMAAHVWLGSWDAIRRQAAELDVKSSIFLYYPCFVFTIFVHESAHGLATKGFGGRVKRMGIFLYFFLFVFYTDVSASWMFPSKFRRLMVLFAGAISNIFLCTIFTLLWSITLQGTLFNEICFSMMTINALAASFTLFPLIRGDGYYILSTALDVPNLSQNSRKYVATLLRRVFDKKVTLPKATNKESLVYVWFAPLQILTVTIFAAYLGYLTIAWILRELELVGFLIVMLVALDRLAQPVYRIGPGLMKLAADALRLGLTEGPGRLFQLLTAPIRGGARWARRSIALLLLIAVPLIALLLIPYDLHVSARFEVISVAQVAARPMTSGIIEKYTVTTGDQVKKGDVVAILVDDDLLLERKSLESKLNEAKARLDELQAGFRSEEIKQAEVALRAEQQEVGLAVEELRRVQRLYKKGIASRKELDAARSAVQAEAAQKKQSQFELEKVDRGHREEEIAQELANVDLAEKELAALDQRIEWTKVRAPADGQVATPEHELGQRTGKFVERGDAMIDVVGAANLVARMDVPERYLSDVRTGMPVALRFFKDPDVEYAAQLDGIEGGVTPLPERGEAGTLGMLSRLNHMKQPLPLGTTGIAKIRCGSQSILGLMLRRAHRSWWVVFWSWW